MGIRVSTKVEEAWYVDPELLAGDEDAPQQPVKYEIDTEGPLPRDVTVALGEGDLEEFPDGLHEHDEDARHYREVSLRGALLVNDGPLAVQPTWLDRLRDKILGRFARPQVAVSPAVAPLSRPPAHPGSLKWKLRQGTRDLPSLLRVAANAVTRVFEPGRVPPILLAAVAFFAGVIATLLGVLLAL